MVALDVVAVAFLLSFTIFVNICFKKREHVVILFGATT